MTTESLLKEQLNEMTEQMSVFKQMVNEMYLTLNKPKHKRLQVPLTPREIQIIKMICKGKMSKEIADILSIAESTVAKHRENIATKTETRCVAQLISFARVSGII